MSKKILTFRVQIQLKNIKVLLNFGTWNYFHRYDVFMTVNILEKSNEFENGEANVT